AISQLNARVATEAALLRRQKARRAEHLARHRQPELPAQSLGQAEVADARPVFGSMRGASNPGEPTHRSAINLGMTMLTLTTDFGLSDWFVGTMKGVILSLEPRAQVADITHAIPAGDIRACAFALAVCYKFFPKKTVHVAVVDPGVGGPRRAIAVQTADYFFVGPVN